MLFAEGLVPRPEFLAVNRTDIDTDIDTGIDTGIETEIDAGIDAADTVRTPGPPRAGRWIWRAVLRVTVSASRDW